MLAPVPIVVHGVGAEHHVGALGQREGPERQRGGRHAQEHDPALYPEPRRFRPERWESLKPSPYEYVGFGAGPRICIGAAFAQQALRLIMPTILQRVRVSIARDARIDRLTRGNILMPRHGLPARIEAAHRRTLVPEPVRGNVHDMVALA